MLKEYREIYKHVMFLKVADQVLLPNTEVNRPQHENSHQIKEKSREVFVSYGSPMIEHDHVSSSREEFDVPLDMDEDMRRAIELSKLDQ